MKTLIGAILLTMCVVGSAAATERFSVLAGLEQRYSKLSLPTFEGVKTPKEFDNHVYGTARAGLELRSGIYLTGRVAYPFETKLPEFALGLEVSIYGAK